MKHGKKLYKLNRTPSHRRSLMANLAMSLLRHERITTTLPKAKAVRPVAEKFITCAKNKSLHTLRKLSTSIYDHSVIKKLLDDLGNRFKNRPGGYTRIYKCGFRQGDNAPMAIIELVDYSAEKQGSAKVAEKSVSK